MYQSTKIIELGSCAFRQWRATHSHCSKLHGYRLTAKFWFNANELDDKNWVQDFGALDELKTQLQKQFDHTTCVAADDPQLETFKLMESQGIIDLRVMDGVGIEKTAEFCYKIANQFVEAQSNKRVTVSKVEVWEHEKNSAIYSPLVLPIVEKINTEPVEVLLTNPNVSTDPVVDESHRRQGANVGSNVTTGKGNWFSGTSWG
jgi:6-pyruvoyltetrahydropterin/6-carboxytetrahydropterin synthase